MQIDYTFIINMNMYFLVGTYHCRLDSTNNYIVDHNRSWKLSKFASIFQNIYTCTYISLQAFQNNIPTNHTHEPGVTKNIRIFSPKPRFKNINSLINNLITLC